LKSYLQLSGIEVVQVDASIEALHFLLSPARIERDLLPGLRKFREELSDAQRDEILQNRFTGAEPFDSGDPVEAIRRRVRESWTETGFRIDKNRFEDQLRDLNDALLVSCVRYYPAIVTLNRCRADCTFFDDPLNDPYMEYYRRVLIPRLKSLRPGLVGISYSYEQQLVPGLSLSREIQRCIDVPLVAGGSFFSILCKTMAAVKGAHTVSLDGASSWEDSRRVMSELLLPFGIRMEGEEPLLELCRRTEHGESCRDIPGLVFVDGESRSIVLNSVGSSLDGATLPILDLDGLPLGEKYLSKVPMAPLHSSRGCYWKRCAFCDHYSVIDDRYRELDPQTVVATLGGYRDRGVEFAVFCDECMSLSMLKTLSRTIPNSGIKIRFGTQMRIERDLPHLLKAAADAGLLFLSLGLESGCSRVVSLMEKGYDHDTAQSVLDTCAEDGILVEFHVMFGFPTETYAEAQETITFLERNHEKIACIRTNAWFLESASPIGRNPVRYGVTLDVDNPAVPTLREGLTHNEAVVFVRILGSHPVLGEKSIAPFRNEDYFIVRGLR
jgi:hypothetical protein